jgi:hypothetical protein
MEPAKGILSQLRKGLGETFKWTFLIAWTVGWTIATASMDAKAARTLWVQSVAKTYPSATGTVVRNQLIPLTTSKGKRHDVDVRCTFEVDGRRYETDRHRFADHKSVLSKKWAAAHPVGSTVRVYYDPKDPARAALESGVRAGDVAFPLILIIFNLIAYGFAVALLSSTWDGLKWLAGADKDDLRVRRRGPFLVPNPPGHSRSFGIGSVLVTIAIAFVAFAAVFGGNGVGPRLVSLVWLFFLYVLLCDLRTRWKWGWTQRHLDLEIDPVRRILVLPSDPTKPGIRHTVAFDAVEQVEVTTAENPPDPPCEQPNDGKCVVSEDEPEVFTVTVHWRHGANQRTGCVGTFYDRQPAERLRDWISGFLHHQAGAPAASPGQL